VEQEEEDQLEPDVDHRRHVEPLVARVRDGVLHGGGLPAAAAAPARPRRRGRPPLAPAGPFPRSVGERRRVTRARRAAGPPATGVSSLVRGTGRGLAAVAGTRADGPRGPRVGLGAPSRTDSSPRGGVMNGNGLRRLGLGIAIVAGVVVWGAPASRPASGDEEVARKRVNLTPSYHPGDQFRVVRDYKQRTVTGEA